MNTETQTNTQQNRRPVKEAPTAAELAALALAHMRKSNRDSIELLKQTFVVKIQHFRFLIGDDQPLSVQEAKVVRRWLLNKDTRYLAISNDKTNRFSSVEKKAMLGRVEAQYDLDPRGGFTTLTLIDRKTGEKHSFTAFCSNADNFCYARGLDTVIRRAQAVGIAVVGKN